MKYYVVATRDIVANVYSPPIFVPNIGQAIRAFGDECKRPAQPGQPPNVLEQHPEDFELWLIGEYDDNTGQMEPGIQPDSRKQIAVGANYRNT